LRPPIDELACASVQLHRRLASVRHRVDLTATIRPDRAGESDGDLSLVQKGYQHRQHARICRCQRLIPARRHHLQFIEKWLRLDVGHDGAGRRYAARLDGDARALLLIAERWRSSRRRRRHHLFAASRSTPRIGA